MDAICLMLHAHLLYCSNAIRAPHNGIPYFNLIYGCVHSLGAVPFSGCAIAYCCSESSSVNDCKSVSQCRFAAYA